MGRQPRRTVRRSSVRLRAATLVSPTDSTASASLRSGRRIACGSQGSFSGPGASKRPGRRGPAPARPGTSRARAMRTAVRTALSGHRVAVVAIAAGEGDAAALPLVGPLRADAGVAGALLAEELLARAGDVRPAAGVDRPDPPRGEVHEHHVVQQLLVDLAAEISQVDGLLADPLAGGVVDRYRGRRVRVRGGGGGGGVTLYWSVGSSGIRRGGRARPPWSGADCSPESMRMTSRLRTVTLFSLPMLTRLADALGGAPQVALEPEEPGWRCHCIDTMRGPQPAEPVRAS